jgi:hypothetical protein
MVVRFDIIDNLLVDSCFVHHGFKLLTHVSRRILIDMISINIVQHSYRISILLVISKLLGKVTHHRSDLFAVEFGRSEVLIE